MSALTIVEALKIALQRQKDWTPRYNLQGELEQDKLLYTETIDGVPIIKEISISSLLNTGIVQSIEKEDYLNEVAGKTLKLKWKKGDSESYTYIPLNDIYTAGAGLTISPTSDNHNLELSLSGDKIPEYSISYDKTTKTITLKGDKEGFNGDIPESTINISDFLVDGMITTIEVTGEDDSGKSGFFLKFTWNTDARKEAAYVDLSSLIDEYVAGFGLVSNGGVFALNGTGLPKYSFAYDENTKEFVLSGDKPHMEEASSPISRVSAEPFIYGGGEGITISNNQISIDKNIEYIFDAGTAAQYIAE